MKVLPIGDEFPPLVIQDLLFKLKIRDVMTRDLITVRRRDTLREAQALMRHKGVTGVPVVEDGRLFGIVSMEDILRVMADGLMDDAVEQHMSKRVVVLEEDMPLSFGATYFDKYGFGRFPVLSRENRIVGILTSRDVSSGLLVALYREFNKLEAQHHPAPADSADPTLLSFRCTSYDFENAGRASMELKKALTARGVDADTIRRAAIAAYEMEINQVVHSHGGTVTCRIGPRDVDITARDRGPGIPDVAQAMEEGFTTANEWIKSLGFGAGMGLANIRRVADTFAIESTPPDRTTVRVTIRLSSVPEEDGA